MSCSSANAEYVQRLSTEYRCQMSTGTLWDIIFEPAPKKFCAVSVGSFPILVEVRCSGTAVHFYTEENLIPMAWESTSDFGSALTNQAYYSPQPPSYSTKKQPNHCESRRPLAVVAKNRQKASTSAEVCLLSTKHDSFRVMESVFLRRRFRSGRRGSVL